MTTYINDFLAASIIRWQLVEKDNLGDHVHHIQVVLLKLLVNTPLNKAGKRDFHTSLDRHSIWNNCIVHLNSSMGALRCHHPGLPRGCFHCQYPTQGCRTCPPGKPFQQLTLHSSTGHYSPWHCLLSCCKWQHWAFPSCAGCADGNQAVCSRWTN